MRTEIPFCGSHKKGSSVWVDGSECINFYPRTENGKIVLYGTPGLTSRVLLAADSEVRGSIAYGDYLYAVCGTGFYKVDKDWSKTLIGTVDSSRGHVDIKTNGTDMVIVDGHKGYLYNLDSTLSVITDTDFPNGTNSLAVVDGFYLAVTPDSERFQKSGYQNGGTWDALDFSSAGGYPDLLKTVFVDHREVWLFGDESTEVWYNNGGANFNFSRIEGSYIETGISAPNSVCKANNAVSWIAKDLNGQYQVMLAVGMQPRVVSTPDVSYRISQKTNPENAVGFTYQEEGHVFHAFLFENEAAEVYDSLEDKWHQRSSRIEVGFSVGGQSSAAGHARWRVNCHSYFNGSHLVGDYNNGYLSTMDNNVYVEDTTAIIATRTAQILEYLGQDVTYNSLQIMTEPGVGSSLAENPVAALSWSDDGGKRWSNEHYVRLGKEGESQNRAILWGLGQGRNRVFRLVISDPVKRVIRGAFAEIEVDNG